MARMVEMAEDPAGRRFLSSQQADAIAVMFADLYEEFKLDEEERTFMTDLLVKRQMEQMDFGFELLRPDLSEGERAAFREALATATAGSDDQIKEFLNDESDFESFQHYNSTLPEREEVRIVKRTFQGLEHPLSPEQIEQLIGLMYEERTEFGLNPPANDGTSRTVRLANYMSRFTKLQSLVLDRASSVLSREQLNAFREHQRQMRAVHELQVTMTLEFQEH